MPGFNRLGAIKAIHALGRQHGYDHEDLRDLAASQFGTNRLTTKISKLTDSQLGTLCATLKGNGKGRGPAKVDNKATKRQLWKMNEFVKLMDWNEERLNGFIHRQVKKEHVSELTKQDAIKVIDGLKKLHESGNYDRK